MHFHKDVNMICVVSTAASGEITFLIPCILLARPFFVFLFFAFCLSQSGQTALSPLIRTLRKPRHSYKHKTPKLSLCFAETRFWKESLKDEVDALEGPRDWCLKKAKRPFSKTLLSCSKTDRWGFYFIYVFFPVGYDSLCLNAAFLSTSATGTWEFFYRRRTHEVKWKK